MYQLNNNMKKSAVYRRCPNCPHHQTLKCCCQRDSIPKTRRNMTARLSKESCSRIEKQKVNLTRAHGSIKRENGLRVNESILRENGSIVRESKLKDNYGSGTTHATVIAQNSILRTQNNHLKRELLHISSFIKEQQPSIAPPQCSLSERLFISNKSLKQALLKIDNLSKINQQIKENNCQLEHQIQRMKIDLEEMRGEVDLWKKKCKRIDKGHGQIDKLKDLNRQIKQQNMHLKNESDNLKDQISQMIRQSKINQSQQLPTPHMAKQAVTPLSPEWIANTTSKLSHLEHNLSRLQLDAPTSSSFLHANLISALMTLYSRTRKFMSVGVQGELQSSGEEMLIARLIEGVIEEVWTFCATMEREVGRKLALLQRKFGNLVGKVENFVIDIRNKKMRGVIRSRLPLLELSIHKSDNKNLYI